MPSPTPAVVDIPSNVVPYLFGIGGTPPEELDTRESQDRANELREQTEELEEEEGGALQFQVMSFQLRDALSELGQLELQVMSPSGVEILAEEVIGKRAWFAWACGTELDRTFRFYHGIVTRFSEVGGDRLSAFYHVSVSPRLLRLSLHLRCRIFQDKSVPQIIEKVLTEGGLQSGKDVKPKLTATYEPRKYCVQYRESDFHFLSRLMEEEGIYYRFEHAVTGDVLVLMDAATAHPLSLPYDSVVVQTHDVENQLDPTDDGREAAERMETRLSEIAGATLEERIESFQFTHTLQSGRVTLRDYNFMNSASLPRGEQVGRWTQEPEVYDYPGRFYTDGRGRQLAVIRMQERDAGTRIARGRSDFRSLAAGCRFNILDHPRLSFNRGYLCTAVVHYGTQRSQIDSEGRPVGMGGTTYENEFTCIPDDAVYRPLRTTVKPVITGIQTAKVVGPAGEEIYTDQYVRVKVQFHWDREGKEDEHSSCWVRVAQTSADKGFGTVVIPRIGTEVVIEFVEGDPDRPLVHGAVYNDQHMPALSQPDQKMCTGLKSNSTPGGGGSNEITLDDTKGKEHVYIHSQYDMLRKVEHDDTVDIINNQKQTIGVDRTESVGSNEKITIGANRDETVGANETITIGANRTENVGANETITVSADRTRTVMQNETVTVALTRTHTVGINEAITVGVAQEVTVGATRAVTVGASQSVNIGTDLTEDVGKNQKDSVGANRTTKVGKDDTLDVGKKIAVTAGDQIVLTTGQSSLTMKKDGTIILKGKSIKIEATQKIEEKAMNITSEASTKSMTKGAMVNVEASGINTIKGSLVKIN